MIKVVQNHIYTVQIRYFGREITKYTVKYGAYVRFRPTLLMMPLTLRLGSEVTVKPPPLLCQHMRCVSTTVMASTPGGKQGTL
jgi:hypothetical protein